MFFFNFSTLTLTNDFDQDAEWRRLILCPELNFFRFLPERESVFSEVACTASKILNTPQKRIQENLRPPSFPNSPDSVLDFDVGPDFSLPP